MGLTMDPIEFIQRCISQNKVYWTYHVNMRLRERFISREMVYKAMLSYKLVESYTDDKYLPSYLVWAKEEDIIFHILFAVDVKGDNVRVVTVYRPDPDEWSKDKMQRVKQ